MNCQLAIAPENPTCAAVRELIAELDDYLAALYPPESNHGLDIVALQDESVTIFLARLGDKPIGCGAIKLLEPGYAEVKRMYVRPASRSKGIAKQILSKIEEFARNADVHTLRLETGIHQPEAINLYKKFGFYQIPPFGDYKPDPLSLFFEKTFS
jgi:putative acetyltransferase